MIRKNNNKIYKILAQTTAGDPLGRQISNFIARKGCPFVRSFVLSLSFFVIFDLSVPICVPPFPG